MASFRYIPNELTSPAWAADPLEPIRLLPGGSFLDINQFPAIDGVVVTIAASAVQGATTISVGPIVSNLPPPVAGSYPVPVVNPIPNGTTLALGGAKFATVNQVGGIPVASGNQNVTVLALPTALAGAETYTYPGAGLLKRSVLGGTAVGRTFTERNAGTYFGPADLVTPDDEIFLVAFDVDDLSRDASVTLVRPSKSFTIFENALPGWSTFNSTQQAKIRALWGTTLSYN